MGIGSIFEGAPMPILTGDVFKTETQGSHEKNISSIAGYVLKHWKDMGDTNPMIFYKVILNFFQVKSGNGILHHANIIAVYRL